MHVHLATVGSPQHHSRRYPRRRRLIDREPVPTEAGNHPCDVLARHRQIEIGMRSRLHAQQRVHTPPAVQPVRHPVGIQDLEHLEHVPLQHRHEHRRDAATRTGHRAGDPRHA
jgi:hypothetical protein